MLGGEEQSNPNNMGLNDDEEINVQHVDLHINQIGVIEKYDGENKERTNLFQLPE